MVIKFRLIWIKTNLSLVPVTLSDVPQGSSIIQSIFWNEYTIGKRQINTHHDKCQISQPNWCSNHLIHLYSRYSSKAQGSNKQDSCLPCLRGWVPSQIVAGSLCYGTSNHYPVGTICEGCSNKGDDMSCVQRFVTRTISYHDRTTHTYKMCCHVWLNQL